MAARETGNVKWFNDAKGYGFIQREDGVDVFVHYRAIRGEGHRSLAEGQQVEYAVVTGEKGCRLRMLLGCNLKIKRSQPAAAPTGVHMTL